MILIDEAYARSILTPIINTTNVDPNHNAMAWKVVMDFWNGIQPELLRSVFTNSLISGLTVAGMQTLFSWKKPKRKKRKKRKQKVKRQPEQTVVPRKTKQQRKRQTKGNRKPDTLLALFRRMDKDKSGRLTVHELKRLARRFKMDAPSLMRRIDRNGNGFITFAEFAQFMRSRTTEE